jgi:hypothetical protein
MMHGFVMGDTIATARHFTRRRICAAACFEQACESS